MSTQQELEAERFIHRGMRYLTATFPEKTREMSGETLKNKLIDSCQAALDRGFETESDMMTLVDFFWRLPDGWEQAEEYRWVGEILGEKDLDNQMKIDALHDALATVQALTDDTEGDENETD